VAKKANKRAMKNSKNVTKCRGKSRKTQLGGYQIKIKRFSQYTPPQIANFPLSVLELNIDANIQ